MKLLFGTGGSGVTFLKNRYVFDNHVTGVHQRGAYGNKTDKIVYSFANPYDILLSFSRRGVDFLRGALINLQGDRHEYFTISPDWREIPITLDMYLKNGIDCFRFGNHYQSYYQLTNEVMFVKYDALNNNLDKIQEWGNLEIRSDIALTERQSDHTTIDVDVWEKLQLIHGGWFKYYQSLPDTFTNKHYGLEWLHESDYKYA